MATTKVLVVDDEAPVRCLESRLLEENGYESSSAGSVAEARAQMQQHDFALAMVDIRRKLMPRP